MKSLLSFLLTCLVAPLLFTSCAGTGGLSNMSVIATKDSIEIGGMNAGTDPLKASGAGYNLLTKTAYVVYGDGHRTNLKVVGGGFSGSGLTLVLEDGSHIVINTRTAQVTIIPSAFGPPAASSPTKGGTWK